ncbi:MAG: 2-C-methyl-D-erythritol 4-phosphate cytidylyltransferase [Turicibacter sp.]|nr:2-C-methyl-D-erythritol 4-phosphate cytidylyltransferase [Turicibacter sp.]
MKTAVIIPAAGDGSRMGQPKQLLPINGVPMLVRTISAFETHTDIDEILIATSDAIKSELLGYKFTKIRAIMQGGADRQSSVRIALNYLSPEVKVVLVHDGARPLVSAKAISNVLELAKKGKSVISGVKSVDTVKIAENSDKIAQTPDRAKTWLAHTPQGFPADIIKKAHEQAYETGFTGTDCAMLVERLGIPVYMVEGDHFNIKITVPSDIDIADALQKVIK